MICCKRSESIYVPLWPSIWIATHVLEASPMHACVYQPDRAERVKSRTWQFWLTHKFQVKRPYPQIGRQTGPQVESLCCDKGDDFGYF